MNKRLMPLLLSIFIAAPVYISAERQNSFADVVKEVNPSVVTVTSEKVMSGGDFHGNNPFFEDEFFKRFFEFPDSESRRSALGSGVIVDAENGYILTNNHVVEGADEINVQMIDERQFTAEIVGRDDKSDLAVLKIEADNIFAVRMGDSDELEVGDWVLAIGSPFSANLSHTVTSGIVSAKGRSNIIGGIGYEDFIQTDAAINPGNSGGALINLDGELVGINTAIATGGLSRGNVGIGFAIPINLAKVIMDDLIIEGRVIRSWLGVFIQDVDDGIAKALGLEDREGVIVSDVIDDSPAEKAGIKVEDIIVKFNGVKVRDASNLKNMVSSTKPGTRASVDIIRGKKKKTLRVSLTELPNDGNILASAKIDNSNWLGLGVENINEENSQRFKLNIVDGVVVVELKLNSAASRSGIRRGDVIVRVGDNEIENISDFRRAMDGSELQNTILFLVKRKNTSLFFTVNKD
tara:strand:+ start:11591 stop:12982 length:1392 start_codon:yes stop_codon:yes gene_type:complete